MCGDSLACCVFTYPENGPSLFFIVTHTSQSANSRGLTSYFEFSTPYVYLLLYILELYNMCCLNTAVREKNNAKTCSESKASHDCWRRKIKIERTLARLLFFAQSLYAGCLLVVQYTILPYEEGGILAHGPFCDRQYCCMQRLVCKCILSGTGRFYRSTTSTAVQQ